MTRLGLNARISLLISLLMMVVVAGLGYFLHAHFVHHLRKAIADARPAPRPEAVALLDEQIHLVQAHLVGVAALTTAAALLLSVALVWLCMRHLTSPLRQLTGHIRRLAGKACDVAPLPNDRRDETGELTAAFNHLMARLCQADRELRKLTRAVEQSPSGIVITDTEGKIEYVNPAFSAATGYRPEEVIGENPRLLKSGEQPPEVYRQLWETIRSGREWRGEFHNKKKDGTSYWAAATIVPVFDEEGRITHFLGEQEDVTEKRRIEAALRESESRFRQMAENVDEVFWMTSPDSLQIIYVSPAFERVWGQSCAELQANPLLWLETVHPADRDRVTAALDQLAGGGGYDIEFRLVRRDGTVRWVNDRRWPVGAPGGGVVFATGVAVDITERKEHEARLEAMAQHDALTGLPNRFLLQDRLQQALAHAQRNGEMVGVMFLDIDHFKQVNDSFGHGVGDLVLKGFAGRLQGCVRQSDTVARLGGDEFIIVVAGVIEAQGMATIAAKIIESLRTPLALPGRQVAVATSIGIALYPGDGREGETLLKHADLALYAAKQGGRNCCRFYQPAAL